MKHSVTKRIFQKWMKNEVKIGEIYHQAFIEVNEKEQKQQHQLLLL